MKAHKFIFTILSFACSTSCYALGAPITKFISVQSPIPSGTEGQLSLPHDWLSAHITCSVTNLLSNDRFSIVTVPGRYSDEPVISNMAVDGSETKGNYFNLDSAKTHTAEFDIRGSIGDGIPLPSYIQFYNASTESLAFGNCTATSE